MKNLENNKGIVVFETALMIQLFIVFLIWGHFEVVRLWREKLEKLQKERISYDGELKWKPYRE